MGAQSGPTPPAGRQVLVVGDRVAGLATAAFLDRAGLSPVVVTGRDRTRAPDRDVVLWGPAVALLAELGVADDLLASAPAIRRWHLQHASGVVERLSTAHDGRWPFVVLDRSRLRGLLRARLPAGAVRLSKTPCGLDPTDSGLRVEFEDGVREPFDAVVGGDGARSWVRRSRIDAGGPATRGTATWTVRTDRPLGAPETVTELWTPDGALTCGPPAGAGRLQFVTSVDGPDPRPAPRAPRTTPSVDVAPDGDLDPAAAAARLAGVVERASFPTPGGEPVPSTVSSSELTLVGGAVDRHVRSERWTAGRVALVGAAARPLSPAVALGASLTVEDAYVLADELAGPAASTEALRRYARRRRGRYRALGRHLPFDATDTHPPGDDLHDLSARRAAVLRSVFARRLAAASGDVSERL